jgi:hypothetical protein
MIAPATQIRLIPFACVEDTPWFLVARPREVWADGWELLSGDALPTEPPPAAALRVAGEFGLGDIERVMDVERRDLDRTLAVRLEAPDSARLDYARFDDARWVPFESATALLGESDKRALRKLNRILDVFLRRIDVVVEEEREEVTSCQTGGACSTGGG